MVDNSVFKQMAKEYATTIRTTLQYFKDDADTLSNTMCGGMHEAWDYFVEDGIWTEETLEQVLEQKNDFLCSLESNNIISAHIADALALLKYHEYFADLLLINRYKVAEAVADILQDWDNRYELARKFYKS